MSIALEPEAASIYCQHIPTEVAMDGNSSFLRTAKQGTKYMIVDLGGRDQTLNTFIVRRYGSDAINIQTLEVGIRH